MAGKQDLTMQQGEVAWRPDVRPSLHSVVATTAAGMQLSAPALLAHDELGCHQNCRRHAAHCARPAFPLHPQTPQMEVGIEDCLHMLSALALH